MCACLTAQVEADPDLEQARTALRRQIRAVSSQLMASNRNTVHTLRGASPQQPSVQLQFTDDSASNSDPCAPVPLPAAEGLGERQAKELRKLWVATAQEVTHLLVSTSDHTFATVHVGFRHHCMRADAY